jgi:acyl dehydratase
MLSAMYYDAVPAIDGAELGVNYGFNKLRFLSPVKAGACVRGHFTLTTVRQIKDDQLTNIWDVSVEIKGQERPALVAEWIGQQYF